VQPNPRSLILNLLLAAEGEPLPAREAVAAAALFGIRENSVRVTLARLAGAGLIEAAGRGSYRLGPAATGLAADVATWRTALDRLRDWDGSWIAVHVGSLGRSDRVALRARDRALALAGLRELERGLFLRPDNLAGGVVALRERLHKLGLVDEVIEEPLGGAHAAREARARTLWDGAALTRGYHEMQARLVDWLARAPELGPEEAARESFLLGNEAIRQLVFDPLLPAPLVDTDARQRFSEAVIAFDAAGHRIWRQLHLNPAIERAGTSLTH